ncbi:HPF/RaiA family ribosome-associated protein [Flavobacterium sp. GSP27]|uniref:HPF/RaiA family ribosome-associated protein n=1 Tax=unclassified Flavobacterium TaxID=196869 RepID=UPI000F843EFD|nr:MULTISPECIES: HPF/RaiA family ribosome-associated protein [unclassified Flavobacterium]RTY76070.1 HPF/RaiA family ribosome-associated protein [Flavobacterium sp. LS1R10]RTY85689.1 HPF/RaiA family ribosome-associated protein [Flavobacterium sp. RSP15]RTZ00014.1 HPF/RaiA family ribosome-associated protein [Flavobacterium sp. RSP49]RTZ10116.1 HPF/RaiA family ribosome-associated protein [Flavobacterium sp. GSP27]
MTVQINTDNNVEGHARLKAYITEELGTALVRFEDKVTRLEVHLGDENSDNKSGVNDKRCLIEARPINMQPVAVTNHADTTEKAFHGALDKIKKVLETTFEKKKTH